MATWLLTPSGLFAIGGGLLAITVPWLLLGLRRGPAERARARRSLRGGRHLLVWAMAAAACGLPWLLIAQMRMGEQRNNAGILAFLAMPILLVAVILVARWFLRATRQPTIGEIAREKARREAQGKP